MIPLVKIWLFETDLLDPYFFGTKDGITTTLKNDDVIQFLDIDLVTYEMNTLVKGAFSETFQYGGEDQGIEESTGKSEKDYELQFNMPLQFRDNVNRFTGGQYSLLAQRVDGSKFVVFGQFQSEPNTVDNRLQQRVTMSTGRTSARLYEVENFNIDEIQFVIDEFVPPQLVPPPNTPTNFRSINVTQTTVELAWNTQEGVDNYIIEYGIDGFTFPNSIQIDGDLSQFEVMDLLMSTEYFFRIKAVNEGGESGYSNIVNATTESVVVDPDAQAWIDRMTAPTLDQQSKIDNLVISLKSAGLFNKIFNIRLLDLGVINSQIDEKGLTATSLGGMIYDGAGAKGNSIDATINSNFVPSIGGTVKDDFGVTFHIVEADTNVSGAQYYFGVRSGVLPFETTVCSNRPATLEITGAINQSPPFFFTPTVNVNINNTSVTINRSGLNFIDAYKNGIFEGQLAQASSGLPTLPIYDLAYNVLGTVGNYSDAKLGVMVYHKRLTALEISDLHDIIQNYLS